MSVFVVIEIVGVDERSLLWPQVRMSDSERLWKIAKERESRIQELWGGLAMWGWASDWPHGA